MPAVSKHQQNLMGIVHALQKGDMKPSKASGKAKEMAKSMKPGDVTKFASTKHKGLPKKVKKEAIDGAISTLYAVKKPYAGCTLTSLIEPIDPLVGIGAGHELVPDQVHSVYHDQDRANQVANELYEDHCEQEKMLEEKKELTTNKIKKAIDQLEKKHKEHLSMVKEDPKNAEKHKQHIAQITHQIDDLVSKLERIEKSKKEINKDDKDKKEPLKESFLGTIALGLALGHTIAWVKEKRKRIKAANMEDEKEAEQAKRDAERLKAIEAAKEALMKPENQKALNLIKNDPEIAKLISDIDKDFTKELDNYNNSWNYNAIEGSKMPPTWNSDNKELRKKIENKPGGKELLAILDKSGQIKSSLSNLKESKKRK